MAIIATVGPTQQGAVLAITRTVGTSSTQIAVRLAQQEPLRCAEAIQDTVRILTATVTEWDVSKIAIMLAPSLILAGCDDMPRARTQSEIQDIAADVADDAASAQAAELSSKISELESKLEDLETEKQQLQAEVETLKADDEWSEQAIESLYENDRKFADRLGIPVEN